MPLLWEEIHLKVLDVHYLNVIILYCLTITKDLNQQLLRNQVKKPKKKTEKNTSNYADQKIAGQKVADQKKKEVIFYKFYKK